MKKKLEVFNLRGGVWLGIWTTLMLILGTAAFILGRDLPAGLVSSYIGALGVFGATKTAQHVMGPS